MVRGFDHCLQLLACVKCNYATRCNRYLFACLWISSRALGFFAQLEVAEPGQLDAISGLQRDADFLEKSLHHIFGFALVEAKLLKQQIGEFGFGERHGVPYWRNVAPNRFCRTRSIFATVPSISACVKVRAVSCISTRIARLFFPGSIPAPRYTSNRAISSTKGGFSLWSASSTAWALTSSPTTTAISRRTMGSFDTFVAVRSGCRARAS